MNPTLEQLAKYIAQELERNVPDATLHRSLREAGWTDEWISAALAMAKQRAMPATQSMAIPDLYKNESPVGNQPIIPEVKSQVAPVLPPIEPIDHLQLSKTKAAKTPRARKRLAIQNWPLKKILIFVVFILGLIFVGMATLRFLQALDRAESTRISNDASRREDLSILLTQLSDYYVVHDSYPTRSQLNDASFAQKHGFSVDTMRDPNWTADNPTCAKNNNVQLTETPIGGCYAYQASGEQREVCNNDTRRCHKLTLTIPLEVNKSTYSVTLEKNSQVE